MSNVFTNKKLLHKFHHILIYKCSKCQETLDLWIIIRKEVEKMKKNQTNDKVETVFAYLLTLILKFDEQAQSQKQHFHSLIQDKILKNQIFEKQGDFHVDWVDRIINNKRKEEKKPNQKIGVIQNKQGNMNYGYILGLFFEKIIKEKNRKSSGSYYTPEFICETITKETIKYSIFLDRKDSDIILEKKKKIKKEKERDLKKLESLNAKYLISDIKDDELKLLIEKLENLKILDPSIGAGHFFFKILEYLITIFYEIFLKIKNDQNLKNVPEDNIEKKRKNGEKGKKQNKMRKENNKKKEKKKNKGKNVGKIKKEKPTFLKLIEKKNQKFPLKELILSIIENNLYGADINPYIKNVIQKRTLLFFLEYRKKLNPKYCKNKNKEELVRELVELQNQMNENIIIGDSIFEVDWKNTFPDIFKDSEDGFDIVIGNPPHGIKFPKAKREAFFSELFFNSRRSSQLFMVKSHILAKYGGINSLVIPKQFAYNDGWRGIRVYLEKYGQVWQIFDLQNSFEGQSNEHIALIWKKFSDHVNKGEDTGKSYPKNFGKMRKNHDIYSKMTIGDKNEFKTLYPIPRNLVKRIGHFPLGLNRMEIEMIQYLYKTNKKRMDFIHGFRGIPAKYTSRKKEGKYSKKYRGTFEKRNLEKFYLKKTRSYLNNNARSKNKIKKLQKEKILANRILNYTTIPQPRLIIKSYWDPDGLLTKSTLVNIFLEENSEISYPTFSALLNSRFLSWFTQRAIYTKYFETSKDFDIKYVRRIIYKPLTPKQNEMYGIISILLHYLQALQNLKQPIHENKKSEKQKMKKKFGFLLKVLNFLVYEHYFHLTPVNLPSVPSRKVFSSPKESKKRNCKKEIGGEWLTLAQILINTQEKLHLSFDCIKSLYLRGKKNISSKGTNEKRIKKAHEEMERIVQKYYHSLNSNQSLEIRINQIQEHRYIKLIEETH